VKYKYRAKDKKGITVQGEVEFSNEKDALKSLSNKELFVLDLKPIENKQLFNFSFLDRISLKDKIVFTKELSLMIKGGLPLVEAIDALSEQTSNQKFIAIINSISNDIKGGQPLSKSMAKYPKVFSSFFVSVIESGEKSGKMDEVLIRLSDQLQKDYDLASKVKSATSYPIVITSALFGVMILMVIFVIPQLKKIFGEMGIPLPKATQIILNSSDFIINYWYIVVAVIVALIYLFKLWISTKNGGYNFDKFKIKVPLFGKIIQQIYMARFTRTMGTLVSSGLPMLDIIQTVKEVVGNKVYLQAFDEIYEDVESGVPLSKALKKHTIFPIMIPQMVSVGERSGNIDEVFFNLGDFYEKEVDTATSSLSSLIEPILIIVIGAAVGVGIASILMPMYSIMQTI